MLVVSPTRYVTPQAEHASRLPLQQMLRYARRKGCKAHASTFDKRGTFEEPTGSGGTGGGPSPFRVTVPSVDVDWLGFAEPDDEPGEGTRFVVVPLNTNRIDDIHRLRLHDPFDDDQRNGRPTFPYGKPVNPDITLHWQVGNCLGLSRGNNALNNGTTINAKTATWPLDFTVIPQMPALSCKIYAKGQVDDFGEKAVDTIHGRVVNVDLDVEADQHEHTSITRGISSGARRKDRDAVKRLFQKPEVRYAAD